MIGIDDIAVGVIAGVLAAKCGDYLSDVQERIEKGHQLPSSQELLAILVGLTYENLKRQEQLAKEIINQNATLFPTPANQTPSWYAQIDINFKDRNHVCILFLDACPIFLRVASGGIIQKNLGPGWVQVDAAGELSTTDTVNQHQVIISYRNDAIGVPL